MNALFPANYGPVRPLRDYQIAAIDNLRESLRTGHWRPVLQLPVGAGKTRIAGEIINLARAKGHVALFVVDAISLIDQTVESFYRDGITDVGVIQADHPLTDSSMPVQVCSVQTLEKREIPDCGLIIVDECHCCRKFIYDLMARPEMAKTPIIGLSATPFAKGMGKHWNNLVIGSTLSQMINDGYLSDFRVCCPSHPDLSGVGTVAGDYNEGQLAEVMDDGGLVADVVQTWIEKAGGQPTLTFAVNRAHARHLQERYEQAGIPCGYIDAFTEGEDRLIIRRKFHSGEYPVVVSVGTLIKGVDWTVRCIQLATSTRSEMKFIQMIGRGLRPEYADGFDLSTKEGRFAALAAGPKRTGCLILDHGSTHFGSKNSLGFVTDIHHEALHTGAEKGPADKRKEPLPKECPECGFLRPPKVAMCPNCGHHPAPPPNMIETAEGMLVEIDRHGKTAASKKGEVPQGCVRMGGEILPRHTFFCMLKGHAKERGFKPGWAAANFKEHLGEWPPRHWNDDEPIEPSYGVRSWIKSKMIKWAKRRNNEQSQAAA